MPKFLAVHPFPTPVGIEEGTPLGKAVKANSTVDAYWVCSWAQLNEEGKVVKLLCQWNATSIAAIRAVIANVPITTEGIYPMAVLDSEDFR
jgi:hypothetical protein